MTRDKQNPSNVKTGSLGTFAGVFTPSVLTILGIILFMRMGYVVGSAGMFRVLGIIALANVISVLTSVSLSAIATNLKVKGGGDYYLISRTLGLEFGGAIGIVLFLAQSVSIAFYCIGFGEAVSAMIGAPHALFTPKTVAVMAVSLLFVLAWLGADWATRFQYGVMVLLAAALVSFFTGGIPRWDAAVWAANVPRPAAGPGFWVLFAIFFPAVTGFTQGVSMSGDLRDPGKSLPLGTFLAVGVSILVYFSVAMVFAGVLPNSELAGDYTAMKRVARLPLLIDAGVIAATLSSAMASFLGAPRILQSLAADRIFPFLTPFAAGSGPSGNPRRGVLLAAGIALSTIAAGNLNVVAPVVSMFFLISYGLLNYATYFEARTESPSFRPRFRWFDRRASLLGFLACSGVMLAIDFATGIVAISILLAILQYLKRTAGPARWADSRRSYHLQRARENLIAAAADPEHPRNWRPQILAFSNDPERRGRLLQLASWLEGRSGMTTVVTIIQGSDAGALNKRTVAEADLRRELAENRSNAFALVLATSDFETGVHTLLQSAGIGPLKINTILLNWLHPNSRVSEGFKEFLFGRQLKTINRLGCNVVILHADQTGWNRLIGGSASRPRLDIWWTGDATSRLMLLLAYLMTRSPLWEEAAVRVLVPTETDLDDLRAELEEARIDAEPVQVPETAAETLAEFISDASLVFLPFRLQGNLIAGPGQGRIEELLAQLPPTVLVLSAEDIDLGAEPEEGAAAEMAAARDRAAETAKQARKAFQDAEKAQAEFMAAQQRVAEMAGSPSDASPLADQRAAAADAGKLAERLARRAERAQMKARNAAREAKRLGVVTDDEKNEGEP